MNVIRNDFDIVFTKDFHNKLSNKDNKIVLYNGNCIKILPTGKIAKVRESGVEVNESLGDVVEVIRNIRKNELTEPEKNQLSESFNLFNKKIAILNKQCLDERFHIKMLGCALSNKDQVDQLIDYFNNYKLPEKTPLGEKLIVTLDKIEEVFLKMPLTETITSFLKLRGTNFLSEYCKRKSILKVLKLKNLSPLEAANFITVDQKRILLSVSTLNDKMVCKRQHTLLFRFLINKGLQDVTKELVKHSNIIKIDEKNYDFQALICAEKCQQFIDSGSLLKILQFMGNHPKCLISGGRDSISHPGIKKFRSDIYNLPKDLEYNTKTKELFVKLGFLGKGEFKSVKHRIKWDFGLPIQATTKQPSEKTWKQEMKILDAAKGLKYVISYVEASSYYSHKKSKHFYSIVFPLYVKKELENYLGSDEISYRQKLELTIEIIIGIMNLHGRGIIHRDLKPANIFLDEVYENGKKILHAYIADVGLSCLNENDPLKFKVCGSPLFIPPDILDGVEIPNYEMDAWALGLIISEFFTGTSLVKYIQNQDVLIKKTKDLGNSMLNPEPKERWTVLYAVWKLLQPDRIVRMKLEEALVHFWMLLDMEAKKEGA